MDATISQSRATYRPAMISERARSVVAIVHTWRRLNVSKCKRSAFVRALRDADALARHLFATGG